MASDFQSEIGWVRDPSLALKLKSMINKICSRCEKELPADDKHFASRNDRGKEELQGHCRICQKKYRRQHYENNKDKYINKAKLYRDKFVEWFVEYKKTLKCTKCGDNRYWVLDFHHIDPIEKDVDVATLVRKCNKKRLLNEVKKCIVVCSNCHRDIHHKERNADIV